MKLLIIAIIAFNIGFISGSAWHYIHREPRAKGGDRK